MLVSSAGAGVPRGRSGAGVSGILALGREVGALTM